MQQKSLFDVLTPYLGMILNLSISQHCVRIQQSWWSDVVFYTYIYIYTSEGKMPPTKTTTNQQSGLFLTRFCENNDQT